MNPLPYILATITNKPRYIPDIKWSDESIVYNLFRLGELIFGREYGIRIECTSFVENGKEYHVYHTLEASLVSMEYAFKNAFKWKPFRIIVPSIQTTTGFNMPVSPYLFAIAFDATSANADGFPTATRSHTITGSDPFLMCSTTGSVGSQNVSAVTWNTTESLYLLATSICPSDRAMGFWYRAAPTTGSHNLVTTASGAFSGVNASSYSGVDQYTPIDVSTSGTSSSATSFSLTATTSTDSCWMILTSKVSAVTPTAGSGTTLRQGDQGIFDSNGSVSSGSNTLNITSSPTSQNWAGVIAGIRPVVSTGIQFDNSTQGTAGGVGASQTYSHTTSGTDRILYVSIYTNPDNTDTVTGVTYAGVSMTRVGINGSAGSGTGTAYLYRLVNPTSGANNVVISYSGASYGVSVATSYTGAKQSGGTFVSGTAQSATNSASISLTPNSAGNWGVVAMGNPGAAPFGSADKVSIRKIGANVAIITYDGVMGTGSQTMTTTSSGSGGINLIAETFEPVATSSTIRIGSMLAMFQ